MLVKTNETTNILGEDNLHLMLVKTSKTTYLGKTRWESSTQSAFKVHSSLPGKTTNRKAP